MPTSCLARLVPAADSKRGCWGSSRIPRSRGPTCGPSFVGAVTTCRPKTYRWTLRLLSSVNGKGVTSGYGPCSGNRRKAYSTSAVREVRVSNGIADGRSSEQETGAPRISMHQVPAFCVGGAGRRRFFSPSRELGGSAVPFVRLMHVSFDLNYSPLCPESLLRSDLSTSWPASSGHDVERPRRDQGVRYSEIMVPIQRDPV